MNDKEIVKAAVELLLKKLPSDLTGLIEPAWETGLNNEPEPFCKPSKGINHFRVKLLPIPKERVPKKFWSKARCFYEMGVGEYDTLDRCRVRFFMAGNQAVCNNGKYNEPVTRILSVIQRKRPGLVFVPAADKTYTDLYLLGRVPDPSQIAENMLWIIQLTFREFQRIPNA